MSRVIRFLSKAPAEGAGSRHNGGMALLLVGLCLAICLGGVVLGASRETVLAFMQRRDQLPAEDVPARMALARWAEQRDLAHQAMALYREVLTLDAEHETAFDRLFKLYARHRLPEDETWQAEAVEPFDGFKHYATDHFLIIYDTDENWARNRGALLEKAHDVFYNTFVRLGFQPMPLDQRLVCVLYADHEDYVDYARRVDRVEMGWSAGYYSSRTNRIVFFDDRTSPQFKQLKQRIADLEAKAEAHQARLNAAIRENNQALVMELRRRIGEVHRQRRWYENRREAVARLGDAMKTVHEAVHQLAFNAGLQNPRTRNPFWLSEGLATNFETVDPAKPFGPMHGNEAREAGVRRMVAEDALIPLADLVKVARPETDDREQLARFYDQSWALFGFLFRHHRADLRQFMTELAENPGERTEAQLTEAFTEAFGDLDRLEKQFFRYCRKM